MIILDTNILSELMKSAPDRNVENWLEQQLVTQLFVTTISIAEISYGLSILPNGKRRDSLENAFQQTINSAFKHRILPFDEAAANAYGLLMSKRKQIGKPLGILDGQIAAIVLTHSATLVTRDVRDFTDCGLTLVNPFIQS